MSNPILKIGNSEIGLNQIYFTVEEGQANLGNFDKALKMIDYAAKTEADAIEFQLAFASDFYVKSHKGFQVYSEREFSKKQIEELVATTKEKNIDLVVAPFSHHIIEILSKLNCAAFNINASDLNNPDILDAVSDSGKPFFLSLLLASEKEIEWAIQRISRRRSPNFGLLLGQHTMASGEHGVSLEHTNLGYIKTLKELYKVPVGFIDHSPLIWMPAVAVAAGADIITKHLALSRNDKGPDWQVCLEPDEMKQAIDWVKKAKESISTINKKLAPGENMDKAIMRRSIVAARQIEIDTEIEREDIVFKRPGSGIPPDQYLDIVGKKARRTIFSDEIIVFDDVK
ncbi:MAG: hypothetical protein GX660_03070 [Clostridiaceae bacterium]|nr:hypothetical protein [Clostridiaceae bacterium]